MKKSIITALSILLTILILVQTMSIAVFAIDATSKIVTDETAETAEPVNNLADMPDIVCEVESKRDACKKDFLMEDGSFCSVISSNPIHEFSDGRWVEKFEVDKSNDLKSIISSINGISFYDNVSNEECSDDDITPNRGPANPPFIFNIGGATGTLEGGITLAGKGFYIKPTYVGDYMPHNKIITFAGISADCSLSSGNPAQIKVFEEDYSWDSNTIPQDHNSPVGNKRLMSLNVIPLGSNNYLWNITDLYSRWDRGDTNNNGIYIYKQSGKNVVMSNIAIIILYRNIDDSDLNTTYHTVDMGKAGNLRINDITNTFCIEQDLISAKYYESDFSLSRIYSSVDPSLDSPAGIGFKLNYESNIVKDGDSVTWNMLGGTTLVYIASDPLTINGDYQLWEPLNNDFDSELWIKTSEINASVHDYTNMYLFHSGNKFTFYSDGSLFKVLNNNNVCLFELSYSNGLLSQVKNKDDFKFSIGYTTTLGRTFISNITLLGPTNQPVSETINNSNCNVGVLLSTTSQNVNQYLNTVDFYTGEEVEYEYDSSNRIVSVLSNTSKRIDISYNDSNYGGYNSNYRLQEYSIYNADSNTCIESMEINSDNTFQRFMDFEYPQASNDNRYKNEEYDYDTDYNLVTHKDTNDVYRCVEYDSDGLVSSYVFSGNSNEFVRSGDFNCGLDNPWIIDGEADSSDEVFCSPDYSVVMGTTSISSSSVYQDLTDEFDSPVIFSEDETYSFGGWIKAVNTCPDDGRFIGIIVYAAPVINGNTAGITDDDFSEVAELQYDNTANGTWQFKLKAFKLSQDSVLRIELKYENQINFAYFDDIILYESQDAVTDLDNMVTSSPIEYTYGNNGMISGESLTWDRATETDLTMNTAYSYNNDGKLREYDDFNGNPTYYQYDSTGMISGKGHSIDNQGNITDVNSLVYDAEYVLTSTTQIIKNVETNANVTLSTGYEDYEVSSNDFDITYVKINHNGYTQVFKYDSEDGGMLTETYAESISLPNDRTNYKTKYQYNADKEIVQIDYSNGFRDKYYEADYPDEYNYKCISRYSVDGVMETLVKTYTYQFDDDGNLLKSYDDSTNIMVDYTNNGYSLYEYDDSDPLIIFSDVKDNENTVRTYSNTYYDVQYPESTPTDTVVISPSTVSLYPDGIKATSSTTSATKNVGIKQAYANYNMSSVEDYFGRLASKEANISHDTGSNISGTLSLNEEYNYKDLGNGKTSGLVSEYESILTGSCERPDENNNNVPTLFNINNTYSRKYEYDNRGNITFVYTEDNNTIVPKEYYEYDNANQIVTEINFENQVSAHYTYDAGGNLTAKIYYDYEDLVFNISTREITTLGDEVDRITYQYDSVWKDRLINYDGTTITYDKMGNPLNYIGTNNQGIEIEGTLEWSGNLLTAFESDEIRIEYQYDRNGFRTQKIVYNKSELNNNTVYNVNSVSDYIWDNGTLNGIIMSDIDSTTGHRKELLNVSFIYDESGSPIGYMSLLGIPYLFKKDIHDSVLSLVFPDGEEMFTYSYDSWGNVTTTYSENWSQDEIQFLIVYVMAALCPIAYHGYLYDYDTGMCFNKGRCYSPDWGRNLNPEDYEKLLDRPENPLEANLYLFCDNNPLNVLDKTASWYKEYRGVEWKSNGFEVKMSDIFASRPICTLFASQIVKVHGSWDVGIGYNYLEMSIEDIASDLFAHYVGKYAKAAINKVNAVWGDGWILKNSKSDTIFVYKDDPNLNKPRKKGKYYKIWIAAPEIKAYAQKEGIFITL